MIRSVYLKFGIINLLCFIIISTNIALAQNTLSLEIPPKAVNFILLGDWGRYGDDHQTHVAEQMAKTAKEVHVNFYISAGDNFYPKGVASIHDPHWHYSFEEIYKNFAHQSEWYVTLGNHDYMGDPDAQVAYTNISRRWTMPSRYFQKTFNLRDGSGEKILISFIDTNPLIPEFYDNPEYGPNVKTQDTTVQKEWLKKILVEKETDVKWNLVVGHHPMYTGSDTRREGYDTKRIRGSLNRLFEDQKIDAYLAGHDHSLQHIISKQGVHHFISGSASEATQVGNLDNTKFASSEYGFLLFSITTGEMVVHAISHTGEILYRTAVKK